MTSCYYCASRRDCTGSPPMCSDCRKANPEREAAPTIGGVSVVAGQAYSLCGHGVFAAPEKCPACPNLAVRTTCRATPWRIVGIDEGGPNGDKSVEATFVVQSDGTMVLEGTREVPSAPDHSQPEAKGGQEIAAEVPEACGKFVPGGGHGTFCFECRMPRWVHRPPGAKDDWS